MSLKFNPLIYSGFDFGPQDLAIGLPIAGATPNSALIVDNDTKLNNVPMAKGQLLIGRDGNTPVAAQLTPTPKQVLIDSQDGAITLSLPQDIDVDSTPTFANLVLTDTAFDAGSLDTLTNTGTLYIGGSFAANVIVGNTASLVKIQGQLEVQDKLVTLNHTGALDSGASSGFQIEEDGSITGYFKVSEAVQPRENWLLKAPGSNGVVTIKPGATDYTIDQGSHNPVTIDATPNGLSIDGNYTQILSIALASATQTGALSLTDWSTFNNKEDYIAPGLTTDYWRGDKSWQVLNTDAVAEATNLYFTDARARLAISSTSPVDYDNVTGVISMLPADTDTNGYLKFEDWNTFYNKEPAITAGTTLQYWRGDKSWQTLDTGVVPENGNLYFTEQRVYDSLSGTAPINFNSATGEISISQASALTDGYISSADYVTFIKKDGSVTYTADQPMGNNKIIDLKDPTEPQDAATKYYVDNAIGGLSWKQAVHVASTGANVPLTGSTPLFIDSHQIDDGERILLKDQTAATDNGIYIMNDDGLGNYTLTRSLDMDTWNDVYHSVMLVEFGTINQGSKWVNTNDSYGTLGITPITFVVFSVEGAVYGTGTPDHVAYWSGASTLASETHLAPLRGGLGVDASTATGFVKFNAGVASFDTTVDLTSEVENTLPFANGGLGFNSAAPGDANKILSINTTEDGISTRIIQGDEGIAVNQDSSSITIVNTQYTPYDFKLNSNAITDNALNQPSGLILTTSNIVCNVLLTLEFEFSGEYKHCVFDIKLTQRDITGNWANYDKTISYTGNFEPVGFDINISPTTYELLIDLGVIPGITPGSGNCYHRVFNYA